MKRTVSLLTALTAAIVFLAAMQAFAQEREQERTPVKVKSSAVVSGVVIVHVQKEKKALDLSCNEGAPNCKVLQSGNYLMAELPPNYGLYDCKNVEMYRGDKDKPEEAELAGAYCLVE